MIYGRFFCCFIVLWNCSVTKRFLQETLADVFEDLGIAHYKLSLTCQNLNTAYSPQLLCITINIFATLVVTLFYWIKAVLSETSQPYSTMYILYSSNSALYSILQIVLLTLTCSKTAKEVVTHKSFNKTLRISSCRLETRVSF